MGPPVKFSIRPTSENYQFTGVQTAFDLGTFSPAAKSLLQFIPLPNILLTSTGQNFHFVTSDASNSDSIILRLVHNFGSATGPMVLWPGGGGRNRLRHNNIKFGFHCTANCKE